ncbi:integral membrane protein [Terfezia boudieri ATCC MYA-4762]|uniref:Integral membrane protein n=1 Tax=Terfezia boudieri ATCC MYA-4762 TaxID=1051890 RepID=A0A3N4LMM6_9PEZI|nr:integral membrane protein [Terfezia boudieri ATCC MYA-4762]
MMERLIVPMLVTGMLATGTANTLLTKLQDQVCVGNCTDPDLKKRHYFEQPVIQTLQMFIGEMGCWLVVYGFYLYNRYLEKRSRAGYEPIGSSEEAEPHDVNPVVKALVPNHDDRARLSGSKVFLLALPACCDIAGTTLMNIGFLFVAASIYQMTRGALVLFVGIFSVIFLKRRLRVYQWAALAIVVAGVAVVGLAGALYNDPKKAEANEFVESAATTEVSLAVRTIIGVLLIAGAQIFTATQFVLEEFILEKYALEPLKVVGWEGVFGFLVTVMGMVFLHLSVGRTEAGRGGYFDAAEGWREVVEHPMVAKTSIWIMVSIGCFNFFGISVTRSISATARSVIDTCRTLFIWMVSLGLGWESFKWLQVLGFALLVYGTFLFNDLVKEPVRSCWLGERKGKGIANGSAARQPGAGLEEAVIEHL